MDRPKYDGVGLPPVGCICIFKPRDCCSDVKIIAHTFVAGKRAAAWQYGDEFGYGLDGDFEIDPDQDN